MKRKLLIPFLALEAALCITLRFTGAAADVLTASFSFPFLQIGLGLRALSLAGALGNAVALLLYASLSLLPLAFLFFLHQRRGMKAEDGLLALLSVLLFVALYFMANPGKALFGGGSGLYGVDRAVLGGTVYAVLVGYAVLRALRAAKEDGTKKLYKLLSLVVGLFAAVFVFALFAVRLGAFLDSIAALKAGNTAGGGLGLSYAFLALRALTDALPWAFDIVTCFLALELLSAMRVDRYQEAALLAAQRLSRWCVRSLGAAVVANLSFNVLQLIFGSRLHSVMGSLVIPLDSIAFALLALLFARLTAENRTLKSDNELFI